MIDLATLALTHGLMALAALILVMRDDLDDEDAAGRPAPRWQRRAPGDGPQD